MNRLAVLIKGEFERLSKYNLFTASFVASSMYVVMAYLLSTEQLMGFLPLIFITDSTMMTIVLVGATLFYEKKEHTINSIMVTPATYDEYLYAKAVVNIGNSLFTVAFVSIAVYLMKDLTYGYLHIVASTVLVTLLHTWIGVRIAFTAKNFASMLISFMSYMLVFMLPSILAQTGVIGEGVARFLIFLPLESSLNLLEAGFAPVEPWKIVFGYAYLVALTFAFYRFAVKPRFAEYMMREMGV